MEKQIRINFNVSETLHRRLKVHCAESGLSMAHVVTALIESALNRVTVKVAGKKGGR